MWSVVGGGPAGCLAALEAAAGGARVVLVDDRTRLGGHLRIADPARCTGDPRIAGARRGHRSATGWPRWSRPRPRIEHLASATAIGMYEGGLVGVSQGVDLRPRPRGRRSSSRPAPPSGRCCSTPTTARDHARVGRSCASPTCTACRAGRRAIVRHRRRSRLAAGRRTASRAGIEVAAIVDTRGRRDGLSRPRPRALRGAGTETVLGAAPVGGQGSVARVTGLRSAPPTGRRGRSAADLVAMAPRPEPVAHARSRRRLRAALNDRLGEFDARSTGSADVLARGGHMTGLDRRRPGRAPARVLAGRAAARPAR